MSGWATRSNLKVLRKKGPDRIPIGRVGFRDVSLPPRQSLIVFGASGSWKTTRLAAPILRSWRGPVLATSVKRDLLSMTIAARGPRGPIWLFDPSDPTVADDHPRLAPSRWDPLTGCQDWQQALKLASWLTKGSGLADEYDGPRWAEWAEKMLAPMFHAAARKGDTMATVACWLDSRDWGAVAKGLPAEGPIGASWLASISRPERQQGSILSAAESILKVFSDPGVAEATSSAEFIPSDLLDANGSLYLCAPQSEQARVAPVFTALVRVVLNHAITQANVHGPLDPPLLCVLDEIANVAPLDDLDTLASTCLGLGIVLVSVFQDYGQVEHRFGRERARTVINNHTIIGLPTGMNDLGTLRLLSELCGDHDVRDRSRPDTIAFRREPLMPVESLRRMKRGTGILLADSCPPARLILAKGD